MEHPSHLVKRTDCIAGAIGSKMNIDRGGIQRFMPKQSFDGEQVGAIFIKVGAKRMSERMAGKAFFPSKTAFMLMDVSGKEKGIDGSGRIMLFWKKPAGRAPVLKPVLSKEIQGSFRENGIAVLSCFGMTDMDTVIPAFNIFVLKLADFPNT